MKKYLVIALAVSVLAVGVVSNAVFAQGTDTTNRQSPSQEELEQRVKDTEEAREVRTQQAEERQAQRILERCEAIKTRLTAHIGRVNEATEKRVTVYERITSRLDAIVTKANTAGYDSTALVSAREELSGLIVTFTEAATNATAEMSLAADAACETDAAPYGTAVSDARQSLKAVRDAGAAIRTTFRETAIPALQEFAEWLEVNQPVEQE